MESAQKLLERSPAADFSKLFQQYSKHLASFSVKLSNEDVKMAEPTAIKPAEKANIEPVKAFEFSKPAELVKPFMPVETPKPFELPKTIETPKPFDFKPVQFAQTAEVINKDPEVIEVDSESSSESEGETKPAVEASKFSFSFGATAPVVEKTVEKTTEKVTETATFAPFSFGSNTAVSSEPLKPFSFGSTVAPVTPVGTAPATGAPAFKPFSFERQDSANSAETAAATEEPSANIAAFSTRTTKTIESDAPVTLSNPVVTEDPASKPFSFATTSESATPFKSFSFGSTSTTTEAVAPATTTTTESVTPFKPFSFGATSATSGAVASAATTANESVAPFKPFSFGSTQSPFSFGSTNVAASESRPTESTPAADSSVPKFSFGASSIGGLAPLPTFSFGAPSTNTFSFTTPSAAPITSKGEESGDEIPPEEAESFSLTRTNTEQLKTGAGEENETCQHEQRCKVFMMDSAGSWIDLGVGVFKINRYNNESGKSRVLCRTEGNGKVILNALVSVPGMNVSQTEGKKEVALLAVGAEGKLVKYLIRVKTFEQAVELKTAILNEIEYVKNGKA